MDISSVCSTNSLGNVNAVINSFLLSMTTLTCNISSETEWPQDHGERALRDGLIEYDYVVVGAGSAGSVVAGRLAEEPNNRVLLLEAGNNPPIESDIPGFWPTLFGSSIDWFYKTEDNGKSCAGQRLGHCYWPKGKVIGGSHSINAMYYIRGASYEYDEWKKAGNPTWGWNDVKPYFKKTEKFTGKNGRCTYGLDGPVNIESFPIPQTVQKWLRKAATELGHNLVDDFAEGPDIGFGSFYGTVRNGRRFTTAKAFLSEPRPNLHVTKNALAYKIDIDNDMKANAVQFSYKETHKMQAIARNEIILSAGSIETPKLLMLSGIGPKKHLSDLDIPVKKDLAVGSNLQDHVRVDVFIRYRDNKGKAADLDDIFSHLVHRSGAYSSATPDFTGFIALDGKSSLPDIQYIFIPVADVSKFITTFDDQIADGIVQQIGENDRVMRVAVVLLKPRSRGYIRLQTNDSRVAPLIYTNYFDKADDMKRMVKGIKELIKFEDTNAFRKADAEFLRVDIAECKKFKSASNKYWECYAKYMSNTLYHYSGTTQMGPKSNKDAVVDAELKVHGIRGLRVVDAGVMPTIVRANINAATIMIGEKGADFIKKDN